MRVMSVALTILAARASGASRQLTVAPETTIFAPHTGGIDIMETGGVAVAARRVE